MGRAAVAFSPGHISGYFRQIEGSDPGTTGSVGAGIVIEEGVLARAVPAAEAGVTVRRLDAAGGIADSFFGSPPVEYALARLQVAAAITTECRLPIGAGFGLSAAALLASITAVDRLFALGMGEEEIAALAHEAEVVHRTGLGDVAACRGGGLACRRGAGVRAGIVRQYPGERVYAVSMGALSTAAVLSSKAAMARISAAFPDRCPDDLMDFMLLSRQFADSSGLVTPQIAEVLAACDAAGVPASMTMLGNGVFACGEGAAGLLSAYGEVYELGIARAGVRLLEG
ncbi:MAG: GHMP kinase [Methanomicrobiaceae archaeon]|nr:GHMP kinase [Methanomicrobiaceae archaeon]MDD5419977.1 pantoate kinase [Methanomicrobiaceae archaeon]